MTLVEQSRISLNGGIGTFSQEVYVGTVKTRESGPPWGRIVGITTYGENMYAYYYLSETFFFGQRVRSPDGFEIKDGNLVFPSKSLFKPID